MRFIARSLISLSLLFGIDTSVVAMGCFCSAPFEHAMPADSEGLKEWLKTVFLEAWTTKHNSVSYYMGSPFSENFGDNVAARVTIIVPSEAFRDSSDEWDRFEFMAATDQDKAGKDAAWVNGGWIGVENYRYRTRAPLGATAPSPDWEYVALPPGSDENGRLSLIRQALESAAERVSAFSSGQF